MSAPPIRAEFARRLKAYRSPRFTTARSFAQALEIDENRYTRYERAEVEPDLTLISKICALLSITPDLLFGFQSQSSPATPGFAESVTPPLSSPRMDGHAPCHGTPRQALAWQLAEAVAKSGAESSTDAYDLWSRTVKIFDEIDNDPFGYMKQLPTDPRLTSLDPATASRIAEIAASFMKHLSADILSPPATSSLGG